MKLLDDSRLHNWAFPFKRSRTIKDNDEEAALNRDTILFDPGNITIYTDGERYRR